MTNYLVVGSRPWNQEIFETRLQHYPGSWLYTDKDLTQEFLQQFNPRYIFFLHWSKWVPKEITRDYECIAFHPTPLPYGRGGSPLQNMIAEGRTTTKVTAFRMIDLLDSGPIYGQRELSLEGSAHQIFQREMEEVADLITDILAGVRPAPQTGVVTFFTRRTPEQSEIKDIKSSRELYDFIRMLDAPTYPKAFISLGMSRLEVTDAQYSPEDDAVAAVLRVIQ